MSASRIVRHPIAVCAATVALAFPSWLSHADAVRLRTKDDLCLVVDSETGAAQAVEIDGRNVLAKPGGLYAQDLAVESETEPVRGRMLRNEDGSLIQKAKIESLGLGVETAYQALDGCVRVHCHVRDLRGRDRALVLSYRLPVDAEGWTWGQDLAHSQRISLTPEAPTHQGYYRNTVSIEAGAEGLIGRYPFAALSGSQSLERITLTARTSTNRMNINAIAVSDTNRTLSTGVATCSSGPIIVAIRRLCSKASQVLLRQRAVPCSITVQRIANSTTTSA